MSISKLIDAALNPRDDYDARKIDRTEANGFIISTVDSYDLGPETAIVGANGTFPVERYLDRDDAKEGHKKWVEKCLSSEGNLKISELGYPGVFDAEDREVEPMR